MIVWLSRMFRGRTCPRSRLLHHPASPTLQQHPFLSTSAFSHACHCCCISSFASLHCALAPSFLHLSHLSTIYLFTEVEVALEATVCHILSKNLSMSIIIATNNWSGSTFLEHCKHWTITRLISDNLLLLSRVRMILCLSRGSKGWIDASSGPPHISLLWCSYPEAH